MVFDDLIVFVHIVNITGDNTCYVTFFRRKPSITFQKQSLQGYLLQCAEMLLSLMQMKGTHHLLVFK